MKRINRLLLFIFMLISTFSIMYGQVPEGFSYQAVARSASGAILASADLTVRLTIHKTLADGEVIWAEEHQLTSTESGLVNLVIGDPSALRTGGTIAQFSAIHWENGPHFLNIQVDDGSGFSDLGTSPIWSVPYAMSSKSLVQPVNGLKIQNLGNIPEGEALFEVRNSSGTPVFAVYEDGVWVFVDTSASKGPKGGFAVGGYSQTKGIVEEYMRVTPDSVRIYIDPLATKGSKGGFAVGGYNSSKALPGYEYLRVTPDSVRVYIDDRTELKGPKGGFAVGGYSTNKAYNEYFNISGQTNASRITSENRVMWYPKKNAFLTGKVLIESPDSIGENSIATGYESKALGLYSQSFGYRSIARGDYSTAMGRNALAHSDNSFAFGYNARAVNSGSFAFGTYAMASGINSFAFGSVGIDTIGVTNTSDLTRATGANSFAFGMGSYASGLGSFAIGIRDTASGAFSVSLGMESSSTGKYSYAVGYASKATDRGSVALGFEALASGPYSVSLGYGNRAEGYGSLALGNLTTAGSAGATSLGFATKADGYNSTALGYSTTALGDASLSSGISTSAEGNASFTAGVNTRATTYGSFVIGQNNETVVGKPDLWDYSDPLFVAGNGPDQDLPHNALVLYKDGNMWISGTLSEASDARLKQEIRPISDVLPLLQQIQPVSFEFIPGKGLPGGRQVGFLAQEVQSTFPELVKENSNDYLSVDYGRMTVYLLEAVKEQQKTIEQLQKELEELKAGMEK